MFQELRDQLTKASRILVTFHKDPDLDAIGSSLAMSAWLTSLGKDVTVYSDGFETGKFAWVPHIEWIASVLGASATFDTVLVMDCSNKSRIAAVESLADIFESATVINWDHHGDNSYFGDINLFTEISSMGEFVSTFFRVYDIAITPEIATLLYGAIVYDTGRFYYSNVDPQTFLMAAWLLENGAKPDVVSAAIYEQRNVSDMQALGVVLQRMVVDKRHQFAISYIDEGEPQIGHDGVDMMRTLSGVDVVVMLTQKSDGVKLNFRSKTDFSVSAFAKQFNGGGHQKAAGGFVPGRVTEVLDSVKAALCDALS